MAREGVGRPRVVIVGAGFGGLWTAKGLARAAVDVTLIDRNNYHTFVPLLYQVAAAELEPEQIAYPVRGVVRRYDNVRFVMDDVRGVDLERREVLTTDEEIGYDYLVLAAGSVTNFFGNEAVARHSFGMKDLAESVKLRSHILASCEEAAHEIDSERRRALLTFVVVGGGPTGVEFAATLAELVYSVLVKDYPEIDFKDAQVLLLEAMDTILPSLSPNLQEYTRRTLEGKGVDVRLGAMVSGATDRSVELKDGTVIPTCTLVWTAGVRASLLADKLGVEQGRGGRIPVNEHLQLSTHPEVYVIGDMALTQDADGSPVPQVAPAAIQHGETAAANILKHLKGEELAAFRYQDRGTMVTIGRGRGVARMWGRSVRGFTAWIAWLVVHLVKLIGFRNRLLVLTNWAWNYIFYDRAVRLILKGSD